MGEFGFVVVLVGERVGGGERRGGEGGGMGWDKKGRENGERGHC